MTKTKTAVLNGKPDSGSPRVRFGEGEVASYPAGRPGGAKPLLYKSPLTVGAVAFGLSLLLVNASFAETMTKGYLFSNTAGGAASDDANWSADPGNPGTTAASSPVFITNATESATTVAVDFDGESAYSWSDLKLGGYRVGTGGWDLQGAWLFTGNDLIVSNRIEFAYNGILQVKNGLAGAADGVGSYGGTVQLLGPRTRAADFVAENGDLWLGSDDAGESSGAILAPGSTLRANNVGTILVKQDAEAVSLSGGNIQSTVEVPAGKTLTLAGAADGSALTTSYAGALHGAGTIVKKGANYRLTLDGADDTNRVFTGALDVRAGTLALAGGATYEASAAGPLHYFTFDDYAQPALNALQPEGNALHCLQQLEISTQVQSEIARGDAIVAAGLHGRAAQFDGTHSVVSAVNQSAVLACKGKPWTVVLWFKTKPGASTPSNGFRLFRSGTNSARVHASLLASGVAFVAGNANHASAGPRFFTETSYRDGNWHMLVCAFNGVVSAADEEGVTNDNHFVSIDGSAYEGAAYDIKPGSVSSVFYVGGDNTNSGPEATKNISIDEVAIYSRVIGADEIAALYAARRGAILTKRTPAGLPAPVANWKFDDPDDLGKDSCGNFALKKVTKGSAPGYGSGSPFGGGCLMSNGSTTGSGRGHLCGDESRPVSDKIPTGTRSATITFWCSTAGAAIERNSSTGGIGMFSWGASDNRGFCLQPTTMYYGRYDGSVGAKEFDPEILHCGYENTVRGWHHIAFAYDEDTNVGAYYMDGELIGSGTPSYKPEFRCGANFVLGVTQSAKGATSNWNGFNTSFDEVKIYDVTLSQEQVLEDRLSSMPTTGSVVDPQTTVQVAANAALEVTAGARQEFKSVQASGDVVVSDGATLALVGAGTSTFGGQLALGGAAGQFAAVEVGEGATLTLASTCVRDPDVALSVRAGGTLVTAGSVAGDVTFAAGAVLSAAQAVTVAGKATVAEGLVVDLAGTTGKRLILSAGELVTGDLAKVTFVNGPEGVTYTLLKKGNQLYAAPNTGLILLFR